MAIQGRKTLLKSNLKLWLNDLFIRKGLYISISTGEVGIYSRDLSRMIALNDDTFPVDNSIYQSAFKNWVHEENVSSSESGVAAPVIASGVTVDGTFYLTATTSGTFAHLIDYPNGRVIFDTPLAGSPVVQGQFSYKTVTIDSASIFNNENNPIQIETALKDNPQQSGVESYPTSDMRVLPAIFIDILSRDSFPYELGTRDAVASYDGVFHLWTRDEYIGDIIEDILSEEHRQVLLGIDFNIAPDPLLREGNKNPSFTSYAAFANVHSPQFWRRIYLDSIRIQKDSALFEVERTSIRFTALVYPIF